MPLALTKLMLLRKVLRCRLLSHIYKRGEYVIARLGPEDSWINLALTKTEDAGEEFIHRLGKCDPVLQDPDASS